MLVPVKCPICEGRGKVPYGFYLDKPNTSSAEFTEPCRACDGRGYMYAGAMDSQPQVPIVNEVKWRWVGSPWLSDPPTWGITANNDAISPVYPPMYTT